MPIIRVDMSRLWGEDDASEYADLPVAWPHDEVNCIACGTLAEVGERRTIRTASGAKFTTSGNRETFEFAQDYPIRFKAIAEHRRQVARSRRAAKAREKTPDTLDSHARDHGREV